MRESLHRQKGRATRSLNTCNISRSHALLSSPFRDQVTMNHIQNSTNSHVPKRFGMVKVLPTSHPGTGNNFRSSIPPLLPPREAHPSQNQTSRQLNRSTSRISTPLAHIARPKSQNNATNVDQFGATPFLSSTTTTKVLQQTLPQISGSIKSYNGVTAKAYPQQFHPALTKQPEKSYYGGPSNVQQQQIPAIPNRQHERIRNGATSFSSKVEANGSKECDTKKLHEEMALLKQELDAMWKPMNEQDVWLQLQLNEIQELAREQRKLHNSIVLTGGATKGNVSNSPQNQTQHLQKPLPNSPPPLPTAARPTLPKTDSSISSVSPLASSLARKSNPIHSPTPFTPHPKPTANVARSKSNVGEEVLSNVINNLRKISQSKPLENLADTTNNIESKIRAFENKQNDANTSPKNVKVFNGETVVDSSHTNKNPFLAQSSIRDRQVISVQVSNRPKPPLSPKPKPGKIKSPFQTPDGPNPSAKFNIVKSSPVLKQENEVFKKDPDSFTFPTRAETSPPVPPPLPPLKQVPASRTPSICTSESPSEVSSLASDASGPKSTAALMQQIRLFSTSGQGLKRVSDSGSEISSGRIRKNSMQHALQNRLKAFCGDQQDESSDSDEFDENDWDEG